MCRSSPSVLGRAANIRTADRSPRGATLSIHQILNHVILKYPLWTVGILASGSALHGVNSGGLGRSGPGYAGPVVHDVHSGLSSISVHCGGKSELADMAQRLG